MVKPIALYTADTHLDINAWSSRPHIYGDSMTSFDFIVSEAVREEVKALFLAGDVIDVKRPPPEVIDYVRKRIELCQSYNIKVFFIQGQHELSYDIPWISALNSWPQHIDEKTVEVAGIKTYGMDWTSAANIKNKIAKIPKNVDVLLTHQVWEEFMGHFGAEASIADLPPITSVFTGDFHEHKFIDNFTHDIKSVISPGSTNMRKIDEPAMKYFYFLYPDHTWYRKQILPVRQKFESTIRDLDSLNKVLKSRDRRYEQSRDQAKFYNFPECICRTLYRIKCSDIISGEAYNILSERMKDKFELFFSTFRSESENITIKEEERKTIASKGLAGCLSLLLDKTDKRYPNMFDLLKSEEQSITLDKIRDKTIGDLLKD